MDNLDIPEFLRLRAEAARLDGIELEPLPAPPVRAEDPRERFWRWVEEDAGPHGDERQPPLHDAAT